MIKRILHASPEAGIPAGVRLTDLTENPEQLLDNEDFEAQKQSIVHLQLAGRPAAPAIICVFPEHYLVFLLHVTSEAEFTEFAALYVHYLSWAEENLEERYQDEYYQIQLMNNQLINSQRALMKSNRRLTAALDEIREANSTISLLERDELTGLYCASAFYEKVHRHLKDHPETAFDIIVLDLDNFKLINEIWGRESGDRLLKDMAMFLIGMKDADQGIFARASADIFYIFMPTKLHFDDAAQEGLTLFLQTYPHPLPMQIHHKIGVYHISEEPEKETLSVEEMCDRARLVLTRMGAGADHPAFYDQSLHQQVLLEHKILNSIDDALRTGQFRLYLQPKTEISTGKVIGAEALIRWIHPELGFIPPDKFIPLLEKEQAVYAVDRFMWEESCRILKLRHEQGLSLFPISVNVARGDLYQKDLPDVLSGLIEKYGLSASELHLEITERAYVNDSENIFLVIRELRERGFYIEMDDFGTGESSLAMLAEMPFDLIKLDRLFLISASRSARQLEIIQFIINLARTLNLGIIAEGVETREQAESLFSMGCLYAQGYLYDRPQPADEFMKKYE